MSLIVTSNLHGLTLFMWIVSVLTLSISNEAKTDGTTSLTSASNASLIDTSIKSDDRALLSGFEPAGESINSTKLSNKNVTPSIAGEGGPISIASTTQIASSVTSHLTSVVENLNTEKNLPKEKDNPPIVTSRGNTVSKIVPRKGANQLFLNISKENVPVDEIISSNVKKPVVEPSMTTNTTKVNKEPINSDANNLKENVPDKHMNNTSNIRGNNSSHYTNTSQHSLSINTTAATLLVKEHKAKPTVTIAGPNNDKRIISSQMKGSHLRMTKKIDYVLPVIVTLIAMLVLGAIVFMVYKQGRDCWDKRHYRRMDFLIDGMYND